MDRKMVNKDNYKLNSICLGRKRRFCKTVVLFILLLFQLEALSQMPRFDAIKVGQDSLYYSKPITNREYLTFLLHNYKIFGGSYSNYLYSIFPMVKTNYTYVCDLSQKNNLLVTLIDNSDKLVKNYIFNPKYIDYPIIGLSQYQANCFSQWYTDRLNEYILVKNGIIKLDFKSESDDNHFSTESYLMGQFEPMAGETGITTKIEGLKWANDYNDTMNAISKLFTFGLRLPTNYEIKKLSTAEKIIFKPYFKNDFIKIWTDSFFKIQNNILFCKVYDDSFYTISKKLTPLSFINELTFGSQKDSNLLKVFRNELLEYNRISKINTNDNLIREKNQYGYLDFRIMGYNENNDLVILYDKTEKWDRIQEIKPFRLVFNKRLTTGMEKKIDFEMPK